MNDRLSQKLALTLGAQTGSNHDPEATDDLGAFGLLRGIRERAQMLTLKRVSGDQIAISYTWIERIEFNVSESCITLRGAGRDIRIRGKHLATAVRDGLSLFDALTRHRCSWLSESSQSQALTSESTLCIVQSIEC